MRRRRPPEISDSQDRWLVSYADFITLLFAFFVVMYSLSTANEGSYRVLSDSIVTAFGAPQRSLDPIQVGELVRSSVPAEQVPANLAQNSIAVPLRVPSGTDEAEQGGADLNALAGTLSGEVESELASQQVRVAVDDAWVELEIDSTLLFPSGSGVLLARAVPVLSRIAGVLAPIPNRVRVEGYTDNVPIRNDLFPSNWELSAARASSVVRLFESSGIDPARLSAVAFGEQNPSASNETEAGRAENRRVVLVVLALNTGVNDERTQAR